MEAEYDYSRHHIQLARLVITSLLPMDFLASGDLYVAYLQFLVFPPDEHNVILGDQCYQLVTLPLGLPTDPRVFSKVSTILSSALVSRGYTLRIIWNSSCYAIMLPSANVQWTMKTLAGSLACKSRCWN